MISKIFYTPEQIQAVKTALGLNIVKMSSEVDRHLGVLKIEVVASGHELNSVIKLDLSPSASAPTRLQGILPDLIERIKQYIEVDGRRYSTTSIDNMEMKYNQITINLIVRFMIPPTHAKDILPVAVVPDSISDEALTLLRQIRDGADVRCFHHYRVPHFTINDESAPHLKKIIRKELYHPAEGAFWDGYEYIYQTRDISAFLYTEETYNDEDGIEERYLLKEEAIQFLDAHPESV